MGSFVLQAFNHFPFLLPFSKVTSSCHCVKWRTVYACVGADAGGEGWGWVERWGEPVSLVSQFNICLAANSPLQFHRKSTKLSVRLICVEWGFRGYRQKEGIVCAEVRIGPSQRGVPGSCESVGGGHLQQLSLQRPQDPIRCIYFSSMCYIQNAGTEIKEIFSLSLDTWGQQIARR